MKMAIGQYNSETVINSFRPGLHRKFQSPLKHLFWLGRFLFSEVKNVDFNDNFEGCSAVLPVRRRLGCVCRDMLAVLQSEASMPIIFRA